MVLFSLAASHSTIDLETVARLSAGAAGAAAAIIEEPNQVSGLVTLATCNRFELYGQAHSLTEVQAARESIVDAISSHSGLERSLVHGALKLSQGKDVPEHLFSVSTGLDSAVVGEREIAGQVKRALSEAQAAGHSSAQLVRLFQAASKTAKRVGSSTALGSRGLSIVSVALDLASELLGESDLSGKTAVIFGTGAYAGATMAQLQQRGCTDVRVFSASGRAETFTQTRGGKAVDPHELDEALAAAQLLVGCSGSDHQLSASRLAAARNGVDHQLSVIDLALTHDFDRAVADLPGVDLLTLETVRQAAPEEHQETVLQAKALVDTAADEFEQAQNARSLDHAIVALRDHTMELMEGEIAKIRGQHGCSAAMNEFETAMRKMVKQMLHAPTVRAKEMAAAGQSEAYLAALETLFGLSVEPQASNPPAK